jgi:DnaJ-class molecular chaperone
MTGRKTPDQSRPAKVNRGDEAAPGTAQSAENVCPACGGSGRAGEGACPSCNGTGTIVALVGDA